MGEKFIDDLLNELHAKRQRQFNDDAAKHQQRQTAFTAREIWFAAFVERIGQLVGAWNEKAPSGGHIDFQKSADGRVSVYHKNAEIEFWLENDAVVGTRREASTSYAENNLIPLPADPTGQMSRVGAPNAHAERLMRPIFESAFAGS